MRRSSPPRDAHGTVDRRHGWPAGEALGHDGALAFLLDWLGSTARRRRIVAVGHRVVHGGAEFTAPVRVTPDVVGAAARRSCRSLRCTSRRTSRPITRGRDPAADAPPGGVLRHRLSSRPAAARSGVRAAARARRRRRESLRLPRPLVRVRGVGATATRSARRRRQDRRPAPRQRRQHVRAARRAERGHHDELHRARRAARWARDAARSIRACCSTC